jgi:hypothetical protein
MILKSFLITSKFVFISPVNCFNNIDTPLIHAIFESLSLTSND